LAIPTLACAPEKFTRFFSSGKNAYPFGSLHEFAADLHKSAAFEITLSQLQAAWPTGQDTPVPLRPQ
jgi:hypothetical protein